MKIETKKFVATEADIKQLTQDYIRANDGLVSTRSTYLRALIGTTQSEAHSTPADAPKVLQSVQARFFAVVLATVTADGELSDHHRLKPEERTRRSLERNRRTNFARSAYSTIRRWALAGHDIMSLSAAKVTKNQLRDETPVKKVKRKVTPDIARARADASIERVLQATRALANDDPMQARAVLDEAMQKIARELFQGAIAPTTDAAVAVREHRPLKAAGGTFWPTESQVMRRQRLSKAA